MKKLIFALMITLIIIPTQAFACLPTEDISIHLEITSAYPNPLTGEEEWVEIKNTGTVELDLKHYTLEDATAKPFTLSGTLSAGSSTKITGFPFQLNNGGDEIILRTINGLLIDHLSYDSSKAGMTVPLLEESETLQEESEITPQRPSKWPEYSESLPNPEGSDTSSEWIELYNPYNESISLEGLKLDDEEGGSKPYALSGEMGPKEYLVIWITESKLTLNNSTDEVRLLYEDEILWSVKYENVQEGMSYAYINGTYEWSEPTPGESNISAVLNGELSDDIEITELLPNPVGPDTETEWIELTNGGSSSVDIGNWSIDDGPGGSKEYKIPEGTIIEPGETLIFYRIDTKIAMNNAGDTIQLLDFTGEVMDEVTYKSAKEGMSYSKIEIEELSNLQAGTELMGFRTNKIWEWTVPSPGELNPKWKSFSGTVKSYSAGLLTFIYAGSEFAIEVAPSTFNDLLFQKGNQLLVQASVGNGIYTLMRAEMIESAVMNGKQIPWSWIFIAVFAFGIAVYEIYKYTQNNRNVFPQSQILTSS